MRFKAIIICILCTSVTLVHADEVETIVKQSMEGLEVKASKVPYSRVIMQMYIGLDQQAEPRTGIAVREIESFNSITTVVVVDRTDEGFVLREVSVPDIRKMRKPDERKQVLKLLRRFKDVPFDPHQEKPAVDAVSGATRYSVRMISYINYLARQAALDMETQPDWLKKK